MSHRYAAYDSNTNNSLFKLAIGAAGFFTGALVGAYIPDLILKPSTPSSTTPTSSSTAQPEDDTPLCVGPECASLPPPRLPSTAVPLSTPSPYESSRLLAVKANAASSSTISDLELYSLLLNFLHLHTPSSPLYSDPSESISALLSHLSSHSFTITPTSLTLSSLRSLSSSSSLVLTRVQVGDEARWLAVVGVDAFYVYCVDVYSPGVVVWMTTREWTKFGWDVDEKGVKQHGVGMVVKGPGAGGEVGKTGNGAVVGVRLQQLVVDHAPEEHPAVDFASL